MDDSSIRRRVACGSLFIGLVFTCGAFAQSAEQDSNDDDRLLTTVTVTAQKRNQDLQDVPITVTAIGSQLLRDSGVRDIKDLTLLTSGLVVTSTSSEVSTTARIRGIGTVGDNIGLESSVGVVIDGVYRPRNGVGFGDLGELERIEVLKGPQGTVFGKNTSAGVINVISKRPDFDGRRQRRSSRARTSTVTKGRLRSTAPSSTTSSPAGSTLPIDAATVSTM